MFDSKTLGVSAAAGAGGPVGFQAVCFLPVGVTAAQLGADAGRPLC